MGEFPDTLGSSSSVQGDAGYFWTSVEDNPPCAADKSAG